MDIQSEISLELNQHFIGKNVNVLVDRIENGVYVGRTEFDSPDVDNEVIIRTDTYLRVGDLVSVVIESATEFDLQAVIMKS